MRLTTHIIFALGVVSATGRLLGCLPQRLLPALALTLVIHPLIDRFGHEWRWWQERPRRTSFTHSPLGVLIISMALYSPVSLLEQRLGVNFCGLLGFGAFLAGAYSHLLLDLLNPSGIFLLGERRSLRLFKASNPLGNMLFQLLGLLLLIYGLSI